MKFCEFELRVSKEESFPETVVGPRGHFIFPRDHRRSHVRREQLRGGALALTAAGAYVQEMSKVCSVLLLPLRGRFGWNTGRGQSLGEALAGGSGPSPGGGGPRSESRLRPLQQGGPRRRP